ncbi:hypothetical protein COV24_02780 [candidate division WWE3 bacterium CG10_big_fil_rev_8_21_14_0_10_32_10]|uniref:2-oxoacid:acceptor oxidoreductase subunit alpha n=1 Tax=candidate division WWE3 bacterium CG10_big_fil_rev_8_21_14_0_10_32_10 TaxID=1975090 RepID=A0A2H0RA83_UNCKA|nr:MAG: hypothetical protein COV24_02780 [candidate division WWE3 bacterium CG10_big_fil_rev_8_21_14_0_10_32_10]
MIKNNVFSLKIGGAAGQGIKSAGVLFARVASKSGYNIYNYIEYPSIIRGGHNVIQVNISNSEVTGPSSKCDFLIALNQDTIDRHLNELTENAGILFDTDDKLDTAKVPPHVNIFSIPLSKLAKEAEGKDILSNTVSLGALVCILGGDLEILNTLIVEEYGDKGEKILASDKKAALLGYEFVQKNYSDKTKDLLKPIKAKPKMVLNGNQAVALGSISAGMQFAAIYPMSPISGILQELAEHEKEFNYIYKQPEDEISGINMAIGASFAGARSMVATSGGGFALMTEGYGLAGMTETPVVIIEGMRSAPATGVPTWSEQGDLRQVLHGHQGDFPKIVLAAGDLTEAFYLTMTAFNLADIYQTSVVLLVDKNICENDQTVPMFDTSNYKIERGSFTKEKVDNYARFALSDNGVSLRAIPGSGNYFIANSDEHDEIGFSSEEIENRNNQMRKRMKKLQSAEKDMPFYSFYGPENAEITIVSWGSNKGSILQALKEFDNVNYLHITGMNPFPTDQIVNVLGKSKYTLLMECNYTSQLGGLIREKTGIDILDKYLKYDGRPIFVEEIVNKINEIFQNK